MEFLEGEMLKLAAARIVANMMSKEASLDYGAADHIKFWPLIKDEFSRGLARLVILAAPALILAPFIAGAATGAATASLSGSGSGSRRSRV